MRNHNTPLFPGSSRADWLRPIFWDIVIRYGVTSNLLMPERDWDLWSNAQ